MQVANSSFANNSAHQQGATENKKKTHTHTYALFLFVVLGGWVTQLAILDVKTGFPMKNMSLHIYAVDPKKNKNNSVNQNHSKKRNL